jgi:hypothetical protein
LDDHNCPFFIETDNGSQRRLEDFRIGFMPLKNGSLSWRPIFGHSVKRSIEHEQWLAKMSTEIEDRLIPHGGRGDGN